MSVIKLPSAAALPGISVGNRRAAIGLRQQARLAVAADFAVLAVFLAAFGLPLLVSFALFATISFSIASSYLGRPRLALSAMDDLPQLAARVLLATALVSGVTALIGMTYTSVNVLLIGTCAIVPLFVMRSFSYTVLRRARSRRGGRDEAVVVGTGAVADFITGRLQDQPEFGLEVVGYADNQVDEKLGSLPRISSLADFPNVLAGTGVSTVVFAYSRERETDLLPYVRTTAAAGYRTYVVPRFFEAGGRAVTSDSVWGLPLTHVRPPRRGAQRLAKRTFDIIISGLALIAVSPILAFIAIVLPRETKGAILFKQERIGEGGRPFELLKFQTMKPEKPGDSETRWNIANDDRLGKFGKFLRGTSLDELPQFWNVLRGDMSLVGPRPERPHFVDMFSKEMPHYADRHRVPVGLTGWAQIHRLRGDTSIDDRARFDNIYCESWSFWEDMKIIVRTVPEVLRSSGNN